MKPTTRGDGSLNLSVQASAAWLSASIGAARACTTQAAGNCLPVAITLTPGTLAAGTYTEFIQLSDPNAVDSPQQISVTVTVGSLPNNITLYGAPGSNGANGAAVNTLVYPSAQVVGATTTQSGGNWLQFTLTGGGSFTFGTAYSIQATPLSAMAPGTYNGTVALSGSPNAADNHAVNVAFNITSSPIVQLSPTTARINASPGNPGTTTVSFTNIGQGTLNISGATVTPNGSVPAATFSTTVTGSSVTIKGDPGTLSSGIYSGILTITSNAANNSQVSIPVSLTVQPSNQPLITQGGVINIATYQQEALAQGGLAAVYGTQLAAPGTSLSGPGVPLSTSIASVQVLVNGVPAPLFYVSTGQINFQVPYEIPAGTTATVQVMNGSSASNIRSIQVVSSIPRIMPWPSYLVPGNYGIIVNYTDGSLALPVANQLPGFMSHPAKPGDLLVIYCLGLGQTSPAAVTGAAGGAQAIPNVSVTFGGGFVGTTQLATPLFAGLSGGVGLYQVNVYVPATVLPGPAVPLMINVNGVYSYSVTVPVSVNGQ